MSTLVVGCGYLGERVARRLVGRAEPVWGTVRSPQRAEVLAASGITPVIADVLDTASLDALPIADRTFYCVGFDRSAGLSMRTVYVNGLRNVLEQVADRTGRLVYASSTGVYGQDDGGWVDEDATTEPRHESGGVCLEAETLFQGYASARQRPWVILRFAGLYGPGRVPRRAAIERGEPIVGDPAKYVNFIHIDDAADAAIAALDRGEPGRVYNVADDRPTTRREFYGHVASCLGVAPPQFVPPAPDTPEARREESNKRIFNRRLRAELGVNLAYPETASGLRDALRPVYP